MRRSKADLPSGGIHGDVPLVVEVDDLVEGLEDAVVRVRPHERRVGPAVRTCAGRRLEQPPEHGDVARGLVEEVGFPVGGEVGVATETPVDEVSPEGVIPVGIGGGIRIPVVGVMGVLRDADIGIAVHREQFLPTRERGSEYRVKCRGTVALEALGVAEVRVGGRIVRPRTGSSLLLGCGERVQFLGRRAILRGVPLRVKGVESRPRPRKRTTASAMIM